MMKDRMVERLRSLKRGSKNSFIMSLYQEKK